jgi:6-pyruvoyltetrahydropterin/6-carboxytetrahydropterin synthase
MKITISKQFYMNCAHSLPHLPEGHKCKRLHGHTYGITLFCTGDLEGAWLIDYADIASAWDPVFEELDHRNLNDILPCITTAENLAIWLSRRLKPTLPLLSEIQIQETETSNVILKL